MFSVLFFLRFISIFVIHNNLHLLVSSCYLLSNNLKNKGLLLSFWSSGYEFELLEIIHLSVTVFLHESRVNTPGICLSQLVVHALLLSIKRLVITMTPATPTATATVPQPIATTMSIISDDRFVRFVCPVWKISSKYVKSRHVRKTETEKNNW